MDYKDYLLVNIDKNGYIKFDTLLDYFDANCNYPSPNHTCSNEGASCTLQDEFIILYPKFGTN